jgi:aspartyl-tRNA(Asn)/glutamyl-tRNA(Gln) amidotransferase subunit C
MTIEDLRETAALAHLNLDEGELSAAFPAFEEMLGFFALMRAADGATSPGPSPAESPAAGISAAARIVSSGWFRGDGSARDGDPIRGEDTVEQMLNSAGGRDGRFVVVPNVL